MKLRHADLNGVQQHLVRNAAGKRPLHADLYPRMCPPETIQHRQQVQAGVFVGGKIQVAAVQAAQFAQCVGRLDAQIQQLLCVLAEHLTGVCKEAVA